MMKLIDFDGGTLKLNIYCWCEIQTKQFLMKSEQDLVRTVQQQQSQINYLREQLTRAQGANFEIKYKKALKEISGIIIANRQLKEELEKLKNARGSELESYVQIQKQGFNKAYQKILKEKNIAEGEKQTLLLENEKLKYTLNSLEESISKLKSDKMLLAQEKEGKSRLNLDEKISDGKTKKAEKDQESLQRKNIENYEEHHAGLTRINKKLEQKNSQLENKIFSIETDYRNKLNEKDIELREVKSAAREEYQGQISNLRKQINHLKIVNGDLTMKISSFSKEEKVAFNEDQDEYEKQLIHTLRDLKAQMQPMSFQISQLQEKNQFEKEQSMRERSNLSIKVVELEAEIQRMKDNQKLLEQKLIRETDKSRKFEETERTIKKLEEENRMLGGRVIVLESKQVALRNRSGDELEERVLEFQTRVEMLLHDKQTIATSKNVGIHQLIALKAYIMELDGKLKQVVNENEYAVKKYKSYKEKCSQLIRELKQHDIAINALKGKLQGYDRLVVKLQGELERAISISDNEMKTINMKISQTSISSIQIYKKRYESLLQKLSLQQKYSEQELETVKLNYETKIVDLNLRLQQLNNIKETIGLYKSKNEQLSVKLSQKENELLQTKMTKLSTVEAISQPKDYNKETIQKLNETISAKQHALLSMESQIRKIESEWRGKYSQLQQTSSSNLAKKNSAVEEKQNQINGLERQLKNHRIKIGELQSKILHLTSIQKKTGQQVDYRKFQKLNSKASDLEIGLQEMKNKHELQASKVGKLGRENSELKQSIYELENQINKLNYESKRKQKEFEMEIEQKNKEIKRMKLRVKDDEYEGPKSVIKRGESDPYKLSALQMDLQNLENQYKVAESEKQKLMSKNIENEKQITELKAKLAAFQKTLQKTKTSIKNESDGIHLEKDQQIQRLKYGLSVYQSKYSQIQHTANSYENQIARLKSQLMRNQQRHSEEIRIKQEEYSELSKGHNKIKMSISHQDEMRQSIQSEYEFKVNRLTTENISLKNEIDSLNTDILKMSSEIRFYKGREAEVNSNIANLEEHIDQLTGELKKLRNKSAQDEYDKNQYYNRNVELEKQVLEHKMKSSANVGFNLGDDKDQEIQRLQYNLRASQSKHYEAEQTANNYEMEITRLKSQLNREKQKGNNSEADPWGTVNYQYPPQNSQIQEYELKIKRITTQNSTLREGADNYETNILKLNNEIKYLKNRESQSNENIESLQKHIRELSANLKKLQADNIDLQDEIARNEDNYSRVSKQLNYLRAHAEEEKEGIIHEYEGKMNKIAYENTSLKDEVELLNNDIVKLGNEVKFLKNREFEVNSNLSNQEEYVQQLSANLKKFQNKQIMFESQIMEKQSEISKLTNQINYIHAQIVNIEATLTDKENTIGKLIAELNAIKSEQVEWEIETMNKEKTISRLNGELSTSKNHIFELDEEINTIRQELRKVKNEHMMKQDEFSNAYNEMEDKNVTISRLEVEIRNKTTYIEELSEEIQGKNRKIADLANEAMKNRSVSTDFEAQLADKQSQLNKINVELKSWQNKYKELEEEYVSKDTSLNRQMAAIRSQIEGFEDELHLKDSNIERYKRDMRELTNEIESLHDEIFQKNNQINTLNQEIFRLKLESEGQSSEQLFKLESEVARLKSKIRNLESDLETKQTQLHRAQAQIASVKGNVSMNKYTDEEYDLLQAQFYQSQKALTEIRSHLSEKDLEIAQLTGKLEFQQKVERETKKKNEEQRQHLEQQLQSSINRERQLRKANFEMQNQMIMPQSSSYNNYDRELEEKERGLQLYEAEVDRLNKLVDDLQEQIQALKLAMSMMSNQEDRILENLTVMTLTFAEVEALRERMKTKENEISEIRKSVILFAGSRDEFNETNMQKILNKLPMKQEQTQLSKKYDKNESTVHETRYKEYESLNAQTEKYDRYSRYESANIDYESKYSFRNSDGNENVRETLAYGDSRLNQINNELTVGRNMQTVQSYGSSNMPNLHTSKGQAEGKNYSELDSGNDQAIKEETRKQNEEFQQQREERERENEEKLEKRQISEKGFVQAKKTVEVQKSSIASSIKQSQSQSQIKINQSVPSHIQITFSSQNSGHPKPYVQNQNIINPPPLSQISQSQHPFVGFQQNPIKPVGQLQGEQNAVYQQQAQKSTIRINISGNVINKSMSPPPPAIMRPMQNNPVNMSM